MALGTPNPYWNGAADKAPRETREEFMFDTEPIEAWRIWDVETIASSLGSDMERFVRMMALAVSKAPENPWEYMLAPRLGAVARADSAWEPRDPQRAVCTTADEHHAPHLDCECGYWALKTEPAIAAAYLDNYGGATAIGRVKLWGRFCEFEKGYRAEYAYPVEVWLTKKSANQAMASTLAEAYGVPVHADEPEFLAVERTRRAEEFKTMPNGGALTISQYSNMLQSFYSPLTFSGGLRSVGITSGDSWPQGIAKPGEFWDEIQKRAEA